MLRRQVENLHAPNIRRTVRNSCGVKNLSATSTNGNATASPRREGTDSSRYEVADSARPGRRCLHNRNYWLFGDYVGIGAGAHGKLTRDGRVIRTEKPRQPRTYQDDAMAGRACNRREVPAADLPFEFMLNALRLDEGFTVDAFVAATGLAGGIIEAPLAALEVRGLMRLAGGNWRPTESGFRFLNDLQAEFLPAARAGDAVKQELHQG